MTAFYYSLIVFNAAVCLATALVVFWRNRRHVVGPLAGTAFFFLSLWLLGFAQYFRPMPEARALAWARFTLGNSFLWIPFFFHAMCGVVDRLRRYRWWIVASYVTSLGMLLLLIHGNLVVELREAPYLDHYIRYNRFFYPVLSLDIVFWQWFCAGIIGLEAWRSTGYRRTQLIYFIVAWFVGFLTTSWIVIPLEYDVKIQPFVFFVFPINLGFLAYVLAKARFADYNILIPRALIYAVTLLVVVGMSLIYISGINAVAPGFMNPQQIIFTEVLLVVIGFMLAIGLPRVLPQAERAMQARLFGTRYEYQDALTGLVRELSHLSSIDQVLATMVSRVYTQMQVSRVLVLVQDPLSGAFKLAADSGLGAAENANAIFLSAGSPLIRWLEQTRDALVRDELRRFVDTHTLQDLETELDRLQVSLCIPMILEDKLMGALCLGEKLNRAMFFMSDIRILETLATEVALAAKYRRMDEEISRKNKLIELGTIAAGVAHEIRNPLASIRTFAQLLPDKVDDPEFKNEFSKLVVKDVERITRVVETMLAFARPGQVAIAEHPVTDLVEDAILLVQPRLKNKQISVIKQIHAQPVLKVDKQQMLQVLINLLSNAIDVLPPGGEIRLATGISETPALPDGHDHQQVAVIEVSDNGPGIPALVRNRIFDPFFTTKKEGTGLGLSISQKIVRDHGGNLTVSSTEGKGTTFQINLPLG